MAPLITVIIPVWRDHEQLQPLIALLRACPEIAEIIVSFAEARPTALDEVRAWGAHALDAGAPNRGRQLDLGAAAATAPWLLFHHADTQLTRAHLQSLAAAARVTLAIGGAFYRKFDERHPRLQRFEAVERWHNRTFGALYGDQSIFVRRDVFTALGGFRALPLMEDVDLTLRLRRAGPLLMLDPPILSSPRKHLREGPWRTTVMNFALLLLYRLGAPPARLHAWYYRVLRAEPVRSTGHPLPRRVEAFQEE